ncbi:papain-like cysteine protease family protein [Ralstonia insidiosa]
MGGVALLIPSARAIAIESQPWIVSAVDQGTANLCWLASAAMMMSAAVKRSVTMGEMAEFLGDPYSQLYRQGVTAPGGGALSVRDVPELARRLGLNASGFASFDVPWWVQALRFGPVMVFGIDKGGRMGHVKILSGLDGDDSSFDGLRASGVDPNGGTQFRQPFGELIAFYERAAYFATVQVFNFGPYGTTFPMRSWPPLG